MDDRVLHERELWVECFGQRDAAGVAKNCQLVCVTAQAFENFERVNASLLVFGALLFEPGKREWAVSKASKSSE